MNWGAVSTTLVVFIVAMGVGVLLGEGLLKLADRLNRRWPAYVLFGLLVVAFALWKGSVA